MRGLWGAKYPLDNEKALERLDNERDWAFSRGFHELLWQKGVSWEYYMDSDTDGLIFRELTLKDLE